MLPMCFSFSFTALLVYSGVWALQTEWDSQSLWGRAPVILRGAHSKSPNKLPLCSRPYTANTFLLCTAAMTLSDLFSTSSMHVLPSSPLFMLAFPACLHSTPCQTNQRCGTSTPMLLLFNPTRTRTTSLCISYLRASAMPKTN